MPKPQPIAPREGEVWDVQLSPTVGAEQSGIRPALVVSNDWFNETENYLIIIVPITGTDRNITSQYKIRGEEGGLTKHSVIMCEQVRSLSPQRFLRKRGEVSAETLSGVRAIVEMCISDLTLPQADSRLL